MPDAPTPSITTWMRLEPRSRNASMQTSLQARVYDPLWLLARQWQFGEFQGEDNGSPVVARWRADTARLTRYFGGPIAPNTQTSAPAYDAGTPLETLVERERVRPPVDPASPPEKLRFAAEAGQQFLRMLAQQPVSNDYGDVFVRQFPFPALTEQQRAQFDAGTINFCDLMAARVPDGRKLYAAFQPSVSDDIVIPPAVQVVAADIAEVQKAARLWREWFETLFSEPVKDGVTWVPERMEYAFSVATRFNEGEQTLTAQEYIGGRLDWYDFDVNPEVTLGGTADAATTPLTRTIIPAPVSFRGMPSPRFWEFEDAQVDFGSVDAGPTDLVRMLLVEFALSYGNDWFVIPIEMSVGSLCRTRSLVISDTFGVRTLIKSNSELPAPHSLWRMFQLSHTRGSGLSTPAANTFFLPPAVIKTVKSRPVEEVLFLRDEMANMAWAVERQVESPVGTALNRFEAYLELQSRQPNTAVPAPAASAPRQYLLSTEVPDYWVPLLPVRIANGVRLQRGSVLKLDGSRAVVTSFGRILETGRPLSLFEEEVPREGVRVCRTYQFTRWTDGSSHLWVGRDKKIGSGEGSSGLRFDSLNSTSQSSG